MSAQPAAGAAAKRLVLQRGALPALALLTAVLAVGGLWLGPPATYGLGTGDGELSARAVISPPGSSFSYCSRLGLREVQGVLRGFALLLTSPTVGAVAGDRRAALVRRPAQQHARALIAVS